MKAAECRRVRAEKADPLDLKNAEKQQRLVAEKGQTTFKDCAEAHVSLHEVTWENPKHRQQWRNTLSTYAYPVIGQMAVAKIETIAFAGGGWNGRTGRFGLAESVFTHYEGTREVVTCRPLNGVRPKG